MADTRLQLIENTSAADGGAGTIGSENRQSSLTSESPLNSSIHSMSRSISLSGFGQSGSIYRAGFDSPSVLSACYSGQI
jgi:hypothetical protein